MLSVCFYLIKTSNNILYYSALTVIPNLLFKDLTIESTLLLICSEVSIPSSLESLSLNTIDFFPSGIWFPLYSSMNSTSLTLDLIVEWMSAQVVASSTSKDKSFSTRGRTGKC